MNKLLFLRTRRGIVAVERNMNCEYKFHNHVWIRTVNGEWRLLSYVSNSAQQISSCLLEVLYQYALKTVALPYEDFW